MLLRLAIIVALCVLSQAAPKKSLKFVPKPVSGTSRIFQAEGTAGPGDIPYQAYIISSGAYLYGGALISKNHVLTSAQAVYGYLSWEVKLGVTDLSANEEFVETRISSIGISHGGFVVNNDQDNIGIILVGEVLENDYIKIIALPPTSAGLATYDGHIVMASGYGQIGDATINSNILLYTSMEVIPNTICVNDYPSITVDDLCAVGAGNMCPGDNGGPLVALVSETAGYIVIGVNAFGGASCESGLPAGFSRVSSYLSWISSNTGIPLTP